MADGTLGAEVDSLEFDTADADSPSFIHVSGDVYAIAYQGTDYDGFLVTVEIDAAGNIGAAPIDSFEYDTVGGQSPHMIHISGNIFAILYTGASNLGTIVTIEIAENGAITDPAVDSYTLPFFGGDGADFLHVAGTIYAFLYKDQFGDGWVKTVAIGAGGTITKSIIDELEFAPADGKYSRFIHFGGTIFAVVFIDGNSDCRLSTFSISALGALDAAIIDTFTFDEGSYYNTQILLISPTVIACVYSDINNDARATTISVNALGEITKTIIDTFTFETGSGTFPSFMRVSNDAYVVAYGGGGTGSCIKTITIAQDGEISEPVIDSADFTNPIYYHPAVLYIGGGVYACAYAGAGSDGFLTTLAIETLPPSRTKYLMFTGVG